MAQAIIMVVNSEIIQLHKAVLVKNMNILVVESDKILGKLIQQYLSYRGISNQLVQNHREALLKIEPNHYDCVLLDISLNLDSSLKLLSLINKKAGRTGVLIMPTKSTEIVVPMVLDLGADDYLIKPFQMSDLFARITAIAKWKAYGRPGSV